VSGSVHIGTSGSASVTWDRGARFGRKLTSYFEYKKYAVANPCVGKWYEIKATKWAGGAMEGGDVSGFDGKCTTTYAAYKVWHGKGTKFTRDTNAASKFGCAFSVFGFSGGAKSGFSSYVQFALYFGSQYSKHWICGNDAYPTE
jgi:hypothetical protein